MALSTGTQLGSYEICALLGEGGMGQVYRARDTRLKREVAIKILPAEFSQDPDRISRFQREAEVLAALNEPSIAAIYELGETGSSRFLVLELVEGETLADRIHRGPIPVNEALGIAKNICEALEAAHDKGVVHRDLKPANVKITPERKVKVLDFGLAKALGGTPATAALSNSPTMVTVAGTNAGIILGTAAYMAPEQARGHSVDRRADIFAFGCVLYEMLTGRAAFRGETVSDILAAVLKSEPDWSLLPSDVPAHIRRLLERCLQKDPQRRLPHISIARFEIDEAPSVAESGPAASRKTLPILAGAVGLLLGAVVVFVLWSPWKSQPAASPLRLNADLGAQTNLVEEGASLALSPNGQTLAFAAPNKSGDTWLVYLRNLDQLQAVPLPGTEGAFNPFFSPDGEWIGFFTVGKLKKISVRGGTAITLCDAPAGRGGSWGEDGTIVFAPDSAPETTLMSVSAAGGKPEPLFKAQSGEPLGQRWPEWLPAGKGVLFTSMEKDGKGYTFGGVMARSLPDGAPKVVAQGSPFGRYLSSGHLVFVKDGTLFAVPFNPSTFETKGSPVPVVENVTSSGTTGSAQFSISPTGTLVFEPAHAAGQAISWMDRDGRTKPLRSTAALWANPRFSPDGRRIAMDIYDGKQRDIWIYDWERDTLSRLTFDPADDSEPLWTPDGRRIAFSSKRADGTIYNIYWQAADGTGAVQRLTESKHHQFPNAWTPNGRTLVFNEIMTSGRDRDLMTLTLGGDEQSGWKPGTPTVYLSTPFMETNAAMSADGAWIAYDSNESGHSEVYVRPFPAAGGKWQISSAGGTYPIWSRTKHELFYATAGLQLMMAPYNVVRGAFTPEKPQLWSPSRFTNGEFQRYDLHPDGQRFAVSSASETQADSQLGKVIFVFNFFDQLRRVTSAAGR
jgi:serine/threonine protein kinase